MKKYKIKYQNKNEIKEIILETSNLSNEKIPANIIEIKEYKNYFDFGFFRKKRINDKKINLLFYELNLMLQANINLSEALDILIKNKKDKNIIDFLQLLKYSFSNAKPIEENLNDFKINNLVFAFLKLSQNNGNIVLNIKALSNLLLENYEIKRNFIKAISYPIILIISFILSLISIFFFVIPKFQMIFSQSTQELPFATKMLLKTQYILENYLFSIFLVFCFFIIFFFYLYRQNSAFNYFCDKFLVTKIFLIKEIYLNMQLYKLFLVIDIMLKSNYEFHKAFISSKILLKNKYLLDKMHLIDNLLQNGKSIKDSFLKTQMFDDIVLNLINTGEVSNSLAITIDEIKKIYKNRFNDKINLLTSLIQPIFLIVIMGLILWIVLAIFMPIWDMGNMIKV
ncbi:transformation system protein [Arcobacter suis]|uniref:Type II secretion/transformation system, F protein n=1 Tax=Arcobacter suis CECT 7833 TaxID=663365 RepID=A0AAD0SRH6_9BACT|nr:type II secretion system F family protein [Arcobacter suis]AXX90353.1 type II secretion/transformation system, F protein [Arcobacter suis CECT 7833]RWS46880.1 transformation system protein [Arcobacter suis]